MTTRPTSWWRERGSRADNRHVVDVEAHQLLMTRDCAAEGCPRDADGEDGLCSEHRRPAKQLAPYDRRGPLPVDELGLTVDASRLTQADCVALLRRLKPAREAVQWGIGDVLAYGSFEHGAKRRFAEEELGLNERTWKRWNSVSRHVAREDRRRELTWSHHLLVSSLPADEQRQWLDRAVDEGWNVTQLAAALDGAEIVPSSNGGVAIEDDDEVDVEVVVEDVNGRRLRTKTKPPRKRARTGSVVLTVTMTLPSERAEAWRAAARARGWSMSRMTRTALDEFVAAD
jgi:hypothetical protein